MLDSNLSVRRSAMSLSPRLKKLKETDGKDKLAAALKPSFDFCNTAMPKVTDATLRSDGSANQKLYGQELSAKDIIRGGKVKAPPAAHDLIALLNKKTPKNKSDPKSLQ
jgi:Las17-binding protein actin regulator